MSENRSLLEKTRNFLERLLALKITDAERVGYGHDPVNIFSADVAHERPLIVATVLAILVHLLLFLMLFPSFGQRVFTPTEEVLVLKQLAQPAELRGGSPPEPTVPEPEPIEVAPEPEPVLVPIPDPTPDEPDPIVRDEVIDAPQVMDEIAADLNIGEITAPPTDAGTGSGPEGTGPGPSSGSGEAAGAGDGVYTLGSGVTNPVPVKQTIPSYTDEAIKAKVQGVVLLQAIIRKNGEVTDFKVLRGLGYGLEEKAIEEIATNWRFRPGTLNGQPVDVQAVIEVQFNLR